MKKLLIKYIVAYGKKREKDIIKNGVPLELVNLKDAYKLGVAHPDKIRIQYMNRIQVPYFIHLIQLIYNARFPLEWPKGIAYGYGIQILKKRKLDRILIAHELVHVRQHEMLGGTEKFIEQYVIECIKAGYENNLFEKEAYLLQELCR